MQWLRRSLAAGCLALLTVASASPQNSQVALASFPNFTRSLLDRSAHLSVRGVTLEEGLNELQARSGVGIAFSPALLAREARVDCLCAASTVGEALSGMLRGRSLTFAEFGGQVLIEPVSALEGFRREATRRPARQLAQTPAFGTVRPAPRLRAVEPLPPRQEPVTGTVVSARTGQPLVGAQVMIEGTTRGVVTNSTGRFLLTNVEAATVTLRVVIIGYREHTETVATGSTIRIELEEIAIDLDAIVVTGTAGGSRTRALGTTMAQVDMTEAMRVGQSGTIQELLSSNVPGLNVASGPGNVGTGAAIKIRGIGSVSLGSGPLIYVDGVRIDNNSNARIGSDQGNRTMRGGAVSRLNDLNPEEIQNVEVIKGPAAATLYGTEASAGVIQITTKRGRVGAPQWEVTVRQGVSYLSNAVDRWPAVYDKGTNQCPNCELLPSGVRKFEVLKSEQALGHGIPFNYGHDQTYGISSRGGTDLIRYYVSAQMDRDEGFVDWNHQNKYSARANLELTPNEQLSIATNMGFVRSGSRFNGGGPFPVEFGSSIYWGTPAAAEDERRRGWNWTPPWALETVEVTEGIDRLIGSATIRHNPFPWLVHRVTGGADFGSTVSGRMVPRSPLGSADFFGSMSLGHVETTERSVTQANVDYGGTATADLPLFGTTSETSFGVQFYVKKTHEFGAVGDQFPAPGPGTVSSAAVKTGWEDFIENKTFGVYVQEQLSWNNRLFLTGALRGDDNSAFGENFDFVVYPKVSGSWVLSEEPFFNASFIDNLKVRAAWGRAGRQPDVFAARRLYAPITAGGDQPGLTTDAVGNPDLQPEVGEELEVGLDASLLNDRVGVGFTFYNKDTRDAIIARPVSPSSGFAGTQFVNVGQLNNRGIEFEASATLIRSDNLDWDIGFNYATNNSEVVDLGGLPTIFLFGQRHQEGLPVGAIFVENVMSAEFDANGNIVNDQCEATPEQGGGTVPCSQAQPVYRGPSVPTWYGGFNTSVRFLQNFRLFALVDFSGGFTKISGDLAASHLLFQNSRQILEREDGQLAAMSEIVGNWLQAGVLKGGLAKLRELSLSYTLSEDVAGLAGSSGGSLTISARNLGNLWEAQSGTFGRREIDVELTRQWYAAREGGAYHQTSMPPATTVAVTLRLNY